MSREETALLVIDLQDRLLAAQPEGARVVWNTRRLVDGAGALGLSVAATEQVPEKLGPTTAELAERLPDRLSKTCFSSAWSGRLLEDWRAAGVRHVVVAGIETHVCVAQTVLDLIAEGFEPKIVVDAVGSRYAIDHETALGRLEASGALLTTTEAALFEWCADAADPAFKAISALAKETAPE